MVAFEMELVVDVLESVDQGSSAIYREITDHTPLGILVVELADGKVSYSNHAGLRMLGRPPEEVLGGRLFDFFVNDDKDLIDGLTPNAVSRRRWPAVFEVRIRTKSGDVLPTMANCLVSAGTGGDDKAVFYFQDLTKLKMLENELWRAQKMEAIGKLAAGIAHDFNNLLTVIQGSVSLMLDSPEDAHPLYDLVKKMDRAAKAGKDITRKLIGFAGKGKYVVESIDLNRTVLECADLIQRTANKIAIAKELSENLWPLEADREQIEQVVFNLLMNAVEAMPMGGNLTIRTQNLPAGTLCDIQEGALAADSISLEVSDEGIGMDSVTLSRIFDPFFTTKEMGRGVGLGLASVHGIVKNHGGKIDVKTEKGIGTTFRVVLPAESSRAHGDARFKK